MTTKNIHQLDQLFSGIDIDADEIAIWDNSDAVTERALAELLLSEYGTRSIIHDELLASDGTFDIQNIPATYSALEIIAYLRSDYASVAFDTVLLRLNNDSGNNYDCAFWMIDPNGSTTGLADDGAGIANAVFLCPTINAPANYFGSFTLEIPAYANTTGYKSLYADGYLPNNPAGGGLWRFIVGAAWRNTSAIDRVQATLKNGTNFIAGSRITLYGLNS